MKRMVCLLLCALMLSACGQKAPADAGTAAPVTEPAPTGFQIPQPTTDPVLLERRQAVQDIMWEMATVRWTVPETLQYSLYKNSTDLAEDLVKYPKQIVTLEAGRIYEGLPYTHGIGNYDTYTDYLGEPDANGVYTLNIDFLSLNGGTSVARIGNSCSGAVQQSWATVATSFIPSATWNMSLSQGYLPVGEYTAPADEYLDTQDTCNENGILTMYEAYAHLQPGDAVIKCINRSGHTMMVTNIHVELNAKGNISGEKSTITFLHQTNGRYNNGDSYVDSTTGQTVYPFFGMNDVRTFTEVFADGYLPITCKELIDPSPVEEFWVKDNQTEYTLDTVTVGTFTTNNMIESVTITITQDGEKVQAVTMYSSRVHFRSFDLDRFNTEDPRLLKGSLDLASLKPGTYKCTHTALLANGQQVVVRDFEFILLD